MRADALATAAAIMGVAVAPGEDTPVISPLQPLPVARPVPCAVAGAELLPAGTGNGFAGTGAAAWRSDTQNICSPRVWLS